MEEEIVCNRWKELAGLSAERIFLSASRIQRLMTGNGTAGQEMNARHNARKWNRMPDLGVQRWIPQRNAQTMACYGTSWPAEFKEERNAGRERDKRRNLSWALTYSTGFILSCAVPLCPGNAALRLTTTSQDMGW